MIGERLEGTPYEWGVSDCFTILNRVYKFAGLPLLDRSVVLDILGEEEHANRSQITKIVETLTIPTQSFPNGGILILTSNDVSFGTGLLIDGDVLVSSEPFVRVTKRSALRKASKILGCYKPKNH